MSFWCRPCVVPSSGHRGESGLHCFSDLLAFSDVTSKFGTDQKIFILAKIFCRVVQINTNILENVFVVCGFCWPGVCWCFKSRAILCPILLPRGDRQLQTQCQSKAQRLRRGGLSQVTIDKRRAFKQVTGDDVPMLPFVALVTCPIFQSLVFQPFSLSSSSCRRAMMRQDPETNKQTKIHTPWQEITACTTFSVKKLCSPVTIFAWEWVGFH